jgi:hypothetical protein
LFIIEHIVAFITFKDCAMTEIGSITIEEDVKIPRLIGDYSSTGKRIAVCVPVHMDKLTPDYVVQVNEAFGPVIRRIEQADMNEYARQCVSNEPFPGITSPVVAGKSTTKVLKKPLKGGA